MIIKDGLRCRCNGCGKSHVDLRRTGFCSEMCREDFESGARCPKVYGYECALDPIVGQPV